jgi:hypothetical protein
MLCRLACPHRSAAARHWCRQAPPGDLTPQPGTPLGAECDGEHDGASGFASDLTDVMESLANLVPLLLRH